MEGCCSVFSTLIESAGKRGFSVVGHMILGRNCFVFQSRNRDFEDKERMHFVVQQVIQYCPFCGVELQELILRNENSFEEFKQECVEYLHDF